MSLAAAATFGSALAACAPAAEPVSTPAVGTPVPQPTATVPPTKASHPTAAPTAVPKAKQFAGVNIAVAMYQHTFGEALQGYLPEFEDKTGAKVDFTMQAFPVYNQRADLELSVKGGAYDVLSITFIYTGRWIGAGWFTDLEPYVKDRNKTPEGWDADDFPTGVMSCLKDKKGARYGFPWNTEAQIACAGRYDLVEKAGKKMPTTFDEMVDVLDAVHGREDVAAYVMHRNHHWLWIPFLMGFGGKVFKNPPENLTPTLDSPEAAQAAEWYASILRKYTPSGALSYVDDQMIEAQRQGRANLGMHTIPWHATVGDPAKSKVAKTAAYAMMPAGPKGAFPGLGVHGFGIPIGARNKDAGWEFIKWALSKEMLRRLVVEKGYAAPSRRSTGQIAEVKQKTVINGYDLLDLYLRVSDLIEKNDYMKYRTVHVFPQAADKLNKAIDEVTTRQLSAEQAMKKAQTELVADLRKAGVQIDS